MYVLICYLELWISGKQKACRYILSSSKGVLMEPDNKTKPDKGYGKRPLWQWVVIYIIVAAIVYGLVYLLFFRDSGSGGY